MNRREFCGALAVMAAAPQLTIPALVLVDPIYVAAYEYWPGSGWYPDARYRSCDYCYETVVEDIWAERPWRKMYRSTEVDGLTVCENCVSVHLEEPVHAH